MSERSAGRPQRPMEPEISPPQDPQINFPSPEPELPAPLDPMVEPPGIDEPGFSPPDDPQIRPPDRPEIRPPPTTPPPNVPPRPDEGGPRPGIQAMSGVLRELAIAGCTAPVV